jgi:hypothetical protein
MKVSSQPYLKTYIFPLFSLGTLLRLLFLALAVIVPFFLTYSTPSTPHSTHIFSYPRISSSAATRPSAIATNIM